MRYQLHHCPRCHLRPVDESDLPVPFPEEDRVPVDCVRCGAKLWAMVDTDATDAYTRVIFRIRKDE